MLRTYTISREGLRSLLWRSARLSVIITVLLIAVGLRMRIGDEQVDPTTSGWILIYFLAVLVAGTWLMTRTTRRVWTSYRLELSDDDLRRTQYRLPEIRIARPEVTWIEEMPGRGMVVRTSNSEKFIFVPAGLAGYDDIRQELVGWAPITKLSLGVTWRRQWVGIMAALLIVAWMVATVLSDSAAFVFPSAFAISVFLLWALIASQRSLHLDRRTKLAMWCVAFPILALALKMMKLLTALVQPR